MAMRSAVTDLNDDSENHEPFTWKTPAELFESDKLIKICAPMVRYSKLAFRALVRQYGCDLAFTPMIIADSFIQSEKARDSAFTTSLYDRPLIVQFAANKASDFADAAEIVAPYADGIDLNCGCPQRWAVAEGYGVKLISDPELVRDCIRQARARLLNPQFHVSIKIRIHDDIRQTVDLCKKAEQAGVSMISIHGRTREQRCQPVNLDAIKLIKENVSVAVVANGDIKGLAGAESVRDETGVNGVMAARGILSNPAMYAGYEDTPIQCVRDWLQISLSMGTPLQCLHHHLMFMMENLMSKSDRKRFNSLTSVASVIDFLRNNYDV